MTLTFVAHAMAAIMVLVWNISYRGGLAWEGICAVFKNHYESGIPDLYSLQSWITTIDFFPGGSPNMRCGLLPWHAMLGLFVYIIAVGNAALGGGLDNYGTEAFLVNFTAIVTILFGAFVVLTVSAKSPSPSSSIDDAETTAILLYETYSTLHSYLYCHFYYH
ncbi:hypothetical protein BRARA_A01550 [Brassica rapa]|uniref:Cytochrome b561 domain-containing protein n=1 Tax=Brassica campestris TaxID=3711 RepID=A0A398AM15_BRACM|nr:hypothetical protein BRARA_A01550 [Brassica rapa]